MNKINLNYQRGALRLRWVAFGFALLASAAMLAIFSMRYERNFLEEGWNSLLKKTGGAETVKKSKNALESAKRAFDADPNGDSKAAADAAASPGVLRKCIIDGKVTYSNVECTAKNPTSKIVKVHDSRGFDAPKASAPEKEASAQASMQASTQEKSLQKNIEKATQ